MSEGLAEERKKNGGRDKARDRVGYEGTVGDRRVRLEGGGATPRLSSKEVVRR